MTEHENVIRDEKQHLTEEVENIAAEAATRANHAQRRQLLWNTTYLVLGFLAAVLAAVSGATGLYSPGSRVPAAVLALLAAGFSAGTAFLRAEDRHVANLREKHAWQDVEVHARLVLAREVYRTADDLYNALTRLFKLRSAVPSSGLHSLHPSQDIGAGR